MMCYGGDVGIFSIGEFVNVRRRCGVLHRSAIVPTRFCGFGAGRARSNSEVFFFAAEIAAEKMLLFFRKPATMDILTLRDHPGCQTARRSVAGPNCGLPNSRQPNIHRGGVLQWGMAQRRLSSNH